MSTRFLLVLGIATCTCCACWNSSAYEDTCKSGAVSPADSPALLQRHVSEAQSGMLVMKQVPNLTTPDDDNMTVDEVLDENLTLQEEQGELAEAFVAYDKDSSGCLNLSELMHGLVDGRKIDGATHSHPVAMHSAGVNESVAQNFLALHDQDLSGCLNLSEFLGADVLKWSQPSALLQTTISGGCLDGHTETVKQIGGCLKKVNVKNIFPSFWKTVTKLVDCFVDIVVERAKDFAGCLKDVFYGAKEGNACAIYGESGI